MKLKIGEYRDSRSKVYPKQAPMEADPNPVKMKYGKVGKFLAYENYGDLLNSIEDLYDDYDNNLEPNYFIEMIDKDKSFVPLYFDIEYDTSEPDITPLHSFMDLFYEYCKTRWDTEFCLSTRPHIKREDFRNMFLVSTASRKCVKDKKHHYKNSYHLKYIGVGDEWMQEYQPPDVIPAKWHMETNTLDVKDEEFPIPEVYVREAIDVKTLIQDFKIWYSESDLHLVQELRVNMEVNNKCIIDESVYKGSGKYSPMRMLFAVKECDHSEMESTRLLPCSKFDPYLHCIKQERDLLAEDMIFTVCFSLISESHRLPYEELEQRSKCINVARCDKLNFCKRLPEPRCSRVYNNADIPQAIERKALQTLKNHMSDSKLISSRVNTYTYQFNFRSDKGCPACHIVHPAEYKHNDDYYTFPYNYELEININTNEMILWCMKNKMNKGAGTKLHTTQTIIEPSMCNPHVTHNCGPEDPTFLCQTLPIIEDGGTFLYQAAKGMGKSEAMVRFLQSLNERDTVLVITYRINLVQKYLQEFEEFGFDEYRQQNPNKSRFIVTLDSIRKADFSRYDYVLIDEVYSVLEHWDTNLMRDTKKHNMLVFDRHIKTCNKLYLLDAELNNPMVVKTFQCMRDKESFTYWENRNHYDMSDYTVHYSEQCYNGSGEALTNEDGSTNEDIFINKIISDLKNNKKLSVMSCTATFVTRLSKMIKEKHKDKSLPMFKTKLYTRDTDKKQSKEDFADVEKSFGDGELKLLMYSPTISAGISFNSMVQNKGFDKQYCYVQTGSHVPSLNTTKQMLRRIRQLRDKEYHILFNRKEQFYKIPIHNLEDSLHSNLHQLINTFGTLYLSGNELDHKFRPKYDTSSWEWNVYIENAKHRILYAKHDEFKKGLKKCLCNPPSDPNAPGCGMKADVSWNGIYQPISQEELVEVTDTRYLKEQVIKTSDIEMFDDYLKLSPLTPIEKQKLFDKARYNDPDDQLTTDEIKQIHIAKIERNYNIDFNKLRQAVTPETMDQHREWFNELYKLQNMHQVKRRMIYHRIVDNIGDNNPIERIAKVLVDKCMKYFDYSLKEFEKELEKRNKTYVNDPQNDKGEWHRCQYYKNFARLLQSNDKLSVPQVMEELWHRGYSMYEPLMELFGTIGLRPNEIKPGKLVSQSAIKTLVELCATNKNIPTIQSRNEAWSTVFPSIVPKMTKTPPIVEHLRKWQEAHPNVWIYDCNRDEVEQWIKTNRKGEFPQLDNMKRGSDNGWDRPKEDRKHTTNTPEILLEGYTNSKIRKSQGDISHTQLRTIVSNMLEDTMGYKIDKTNKIVDPLEWMEQFRVEVADPRDPSFILED